MYVPPSVLLEGLGTCTICKRVFITPTVIIREGTAAVNYQHLGVIANIAVNERNL